MKMSDFQNIDFQRLGTWPNSVKSVVGGVIFLIIGGIGWYFWVQPLRDQLASVEGKEQELRQTFEGKQKKVANLEAYKKQLDDIREMLKQMLRQLPSKTEMPDLLVDVSQTALSTGIDTQKFQPGAEMPKASYAEKPIELSMIGTYHQFGSFISGVASLPRVVILTMHDISLKPAGTGAKGESVPAGALKLEGTVKTYRYLEDDEAAGAAPSPAPPAGKAPPAAAAPAEPKRT